MQNPAAGTDDTAAEQPALVRWLSSRTCLAVILAIGTGLRVAHVLALRQLPLFERLTIDSEVYDVWAQRIAAGDWLSRIIDRPFFMDPLYSYFLAGIYRVFGRDLLLVRLLQVAMGVLTCWIVARLAERLHGPLAANLGALLMALFAPSIFQEGEFEKTALGVLLAAAALLLFLRDSWRSRAAAGAAYALAGMTRGNILLLGPLAIGYLLIARRRWDALAFAAAAGLAIAPVTVRNYVVSGEFVPTISSGGANLYTGNNPANPDGAYNAVPFVRAQAKYEEGDFLAEAVRRSGRPLSASEASSFWARTALEYMFSNPGTTLRRFASKAALFWGDVEIADGWAMEFIAGYSPVLRAPLVPFALLLALAVLGIPWAARRRDGRVVLAYVALYGASVIVFFILSRYRLYVVPALAALAGVGVVATIDDVRRRRGRAVAAIGAVALAVGLASRLALPARPWQVVNSYVTLAEIQLERGDPGAARRTLNTSLERWPGAAPTLCELAKLDLVEGAPGFGLELASRCVQADPNALNGWYLVGLGWEANGDRERAVEAYRRQLQVVPGHEGALQRLGADGAR